MLRLGVNGAADGLWRPDTSPTQPRQAGGGPERLEWGWGYGTMNMLCASIVGEVVSLRPRSSIMPALAVMNKKMPQLEERIYRNQQSTTMAPGTTDSITNSEGVVSKKTTLSISSSIKVNGPIPTSVWLFSNAAADCIISHAQLGVSSEIRSSRFFLWASKRRVLRQWENKAITSTFQGGCCRRWTWRSCHSNCPGPERSHCYCT